MDSEKLPKDQIIKSIVFYNENEIQSIKDNAIEMSTRLPYSSIIALNSDKPAHNYVTMRSLIYNEVKDGTQLNLLIDITTFTHETLLNLFKIIQIFNKSISSLHVAYSGAKEYSCGEIDDNLKWLSKGIKNIRNIIGYPGLYEPMKNNHLIVLFGFEYQRTISLIEKYEYDILSLGFCEESTAMQSNHYKINRERHMQLLNKYDGSLKFTFSLNNPYITKKNITDHIELNNLELSNTVIAPMNNKISTLGAALYAFESPTIQLAYAQPLIYNTDNYSSPSNKIYLSEINFGKS